MTSTRTQLRAAFEELAQDAPDSVPFQAARPLTSVRPGIEPVRRPAARRWHPWVPVAATVAVVLLVALVSSVALIGRRDHGSSPSLAAPVPARNTAVQWWFGPESVPGYRPSFLSLEPDLQEFDYVIGAAPVLPTAPRAQAIIRVFTPTAAQRATIDSLPSAQVAGTAGHFGQLQDTATCDRMLAWGSCPTWMAIWPLSGTDRWAVMIAQSASRASVSATQLRTLAESVRRADEPRVSAFKVGYLPARLRLASVVRDYDDPGIEMYGSRGGHTLKFRLPGQPDGEQLQVGTIDHPNVPFAQLTPALLARDVHPGSWIRTTVQGQPAWTSPLDILVQWDHHLVVIGTGTAVGGTSDTAPAVPHSELVKIAAALSFAGSDDYGVGWPLSEAIPAGAGW